MAVLAIPFAVSGRTGGALAGVAIAISIAVVYIGMAGLFEAMGNANQLPAMLAAWSPDVVFGLGGWIHVASSADIAHRLPPYVCNQLSNSG